MTNVQEACASCGASTARAEAGHVYLGTGPTHDVAAYTFCVRCWARHHRALALAVERAVTSARDDETANGVSPPSEPPQVTEDELNT